VSRSVAVEGQLGARCHTRRRSTAEEHLAIATHAEKNGRLIALVVYTSLRSVYANSPFTCVIIYPLAYPEEG